MPEHLFRSLAVVVGFAGIPSDLVGQFVTPVPRALSGQAVRANSILNAVHETLTEIDSTCLRGGNVDAERICRTAPHHVQTLTAEIGRYCRGAYVQPADIDRCLASVKPDSVLRVRAKAGAKWFVPLTRGREGLEEVYESVADFAVLTSFAANARDDQIFILTDIVSGAIGPFPFAATVAAIVSKDDTVILGAGTPAQDTIGGTKSLLVRAINNGGSVSGRILAPILFRQGATISYSQSAYVQLGFLGPLSKSDSLQGSGALVAEGLASFAIRKLDRSADHIGELLVGWRVGYVFSEASFQPGVVNRRNFWFYQFGAGIRSGGKLSVSVLMTVPMSRELKRFVPRVMVNLAAVRF